MSIIQTSKIKGITSFTTYDNGAIKQCKTNKYNSIHTKYGDFVPQYKDPGIRKKDLKSMSFYKSGNIKSISLEEQTIVTTSAGIFPAELVTFFEDGSLDSIFPLNGKISFSWSEEEESQLSQKFNFEFPFGKFSTEIIGLRFYKNGNIRSLVLWPNETIIINTPIGKMPVRIGFKLYEDGMLESFEPAQPILVKTPIGFVNSFDKTALAVDADKNSMRFDRNGKLESLVTSSDIIIESKSNGYSKMISSKLRIGLMEDDFIKMPYKLIFIDETVIIDDGNDTMEFKIDEYTFSVISDDRIESYYRCTGCM